MCEMDEQSSWIEPRLLTFGNACNQLSKKKKKRTDQADNLEICHSIIQWRGLPKFREE